MIRHSNLKIASGLSLAALLISGLTATAIGAPATPPKTSIEAKSGAQANAPVTSGKGVVDAYVLKETSTFVGPVEMTVSDGGIKFAMSKMGLVWMTFPPKWDGYAYNPESKSYLVRPHSEWKKKLFNLPTSKKHLEEGPHFTIKDTGKKEMIEGYNCDKQALITPPSPKHKLGEPTKPYIAGYIWVAKDFPAPKEVGELMSNFVKVEVSKGVVLKAEMLKANSFTEFRPVFETLKITKKKVPASIFEAPKNFKLVTTELQLMMGDSDSEMPSTNGLGGGAGGGMPGGGMGGGDADALLKKLKSQ